MRSGRLAIAIFASLGLLWTATAHAQIPPQQPTPTPTPGSSTDKAGVAEQAPKTAGKLPTVPTLPPRKDRGKAFELTLNNGYFRWRGDWLKKFDLGFSDDPTDGGAPFPNPLGCQSAGGDCNDTHKSSNIRLRLEPVIHLGERAGSTRTASVHMQVDVVDNLVLGSTPDSFFGDGTASPGNSPLEAFSGSQAPVQAGRNSKSDSLVVRRAWAEIFTPFGELKVGRMPSHWGMGILTNAGGEDPIHGGYDLDSDFGDTVDRLIFNAQIPGTNLRGAVGTDWTSTAPAASQTDLFLNTYDDQPFDLDDNDDVTQWVFAISRLDSPKDFADRVADGELVVNYGAYFLYRNQDFSHTGVTIGEAPPTDTLVARGLTEYIPDLWGRLAWKDLELEVEAVAVLGEVDELSDLGLVRGDPDEPAAKIRSWGGVGRVTYKLVDGDLRLGGEVGIASGDQFDSDVPGRTNVAQSSLVPSGSVSRQQGDDITAFRFNFDYEIDLILFRELIGTVTNTTYLRPMLQYELTDRITVKAQSVISFVNKAVSTPGNGGMYGIEFDGDLGYQNHGFFAGVSYGVLFPLSALDHPATIGNEGGTGFGFPNTPQVSGRKSVGDAETAQTIQFRLMLKF